MKRLLLFWLFTGSLAEAGWWSKSPELPSCKELYATTYGPTKRDLAQVNGLDEFFDIITPLPGHADELNQDVLQALKKEPVPKGSGSRRITELTARQLGQLFTEIKENPQVKETLLCNERYKNSDRQGFCFGRTVAAHLRTLQFGVHNKSIRKVWAVGRLEMDGLEWKYHGATIVRAKGGGWYALDPFLPKPVTVAEWYRIMREEYNPSRTLRLFATPAKQLGRSGKYSQEKFSNTVFNGFFEDLLVEIRKSNRPKGSQQVPAAGVEERRFSDAWLKSGAGAAGAGISAAGMYELYKMSQEKND